MCSTYFRRVNVAISILLKRPIILPKHKAGEDYSLVTACTRFEIVNVVFRVRRIAYDQQPVCSSDFLKGLNDEMCVVFRLETRHVQNVSIWLDTPLPNRSALRTSLNLTA